MGTPAGTHAEFQSRTEGPVPKRSRCAGKRSIDGVDVVEGFAANPPAHAVATALRIAGVRTMEDVAPVQTDLYRVAGIEDALERATQEHAAFKELGLPWAP